MVLEHGFKMLPCHHNVKELIEYQQDLRDIKLDEFYQEAHDLGFTAIEVSDGSSHIPHDEKLEYIREAKKEGFEVLSEVGKKNPDLDKEITVAERVEFMKEEYKAGSSLVIVEAREGGKNIGIYDSKGNAKESEIDYILDNFDSNKILWEAFFFFFSSKNK